MSAIYYDRVKETTDTAGTGPLALGGAPTGYQPFSVVGNGNTCYYCVAERTGGGWEVGLGTYQWAGNLLARTSVLASSNGGAAVELMVGTKDVLLVVPAASAAAFARTDQSNTFSGTQTGSFAGPLAGNAATASLAADSSLLGGHAASYFLDSANVLPAQAGQAGNFLKTNGTVASWASVPASSPGGSAGALQYNTGSAFGGATGLAYSATGTHLTVTAQANDKIPLAVAAATNQSANIQEWRDSSGTVLARVDPHGNVVVGGTGTGVASYNLDVTGTGRFTDWLNCAANRGITALGDFYIKRSLNVFVFGDTTTYHGTNQLSGAAHSFRLGDAVGGTEVLRLQATTQTAQVTAAGTGVVGLAVKSAGTQTVNLQEWQDSGGAALAAVSKNGGLAPASMADSAAVNGTVYYSTTANKLVFKDSAGVVNALY
jgi:hypothetical protein